MARMIAVPRFGGRAFLLLFDVSSQRYYMLEVRDVRTLASGDVVFVTREGFEVTVPIESIVDGVDSTNTNVVYIVFSKTAIQFDPKRRVVRFEPYDRSIIDIAAEVGKSLFDTIAEKLSALAEQARECRLMATYREADCWLQCLSMMNEVRRTISEAMEQLMAGNIDEARSVIVSRLETVYEGIYTRLSKVKDRVRRLQELRRELIEIAKQFGIPPERAEQMKLSELVSVLQDMISLSEAVKQESSSE